MFKQGGHKILAELIFGILFFIVILIIAFTRTGQQGTEKNEPKFGITFSFLYAQDLGLDWRGAYLAMLDDLEARYFRIPVPWSVLEKSSGEIWWNDIDFMMDEAEKRGVKITLAIGRKVPRWPECYIPDWAERLGREQQNQALLDFMENVVVHYKDHPAMQRWQVENEPFFPYGECPTPDPKLFQQELKLVRSLSDLPIMSTTSGENDLWIDVASNVDILGVSLYRTTWSDVLGYFIFPYGPDFYRAKSILTASVVDSIIISELQAEPWFRKPVLETPLEEQIALFDAPELLESVDFAKKTGLGEVYLWGAEWWYYVKLKGEDSLWNTAREIF